MRTLMKLAIVVLFGAALVPRAQGWQELGAVPGGLCSSGSGVCYGDYNGENLVYALHMYDANIGQLSVWHPNRTPPWNADVAHLTPWGPGGAVCWYQDPSLPAGGYVFALSGNGTNVFSRYPSGGNAWIPLTNSPVPDNVTVGGALCWGGFHWSSMGVPYAWLFALTGTEDQSNCGKFFCYSFTVWPCDPPIGWTLLASLPEQVGTGSALTWMPPGPNPDPGAASGYIYALSGEHSGRTHNLHRYNLADGTWDSQGWPKALPWAEGAARGAALAADTVLHEVLIFRGAGTDDVAIFYEPSDTLVDGPDLPHAEHEQAAMGWDPIDNWVYAELGQTEDFWGRTQLQFGGGMGGAQSLRSSIRTQTPNLTVVPARDAYRFVVANTDAPAARLTVSDINGRRLISSVVATNGHSAVLTWNHQSAAPGVYFCTVQIGRSELRRKLLLVK